MKTSLPLLRVGGVLRLSALTLALFLLTGCAGVVIIPTLPGKTAYGQRTEANQVAFIRPGQTTRSEVIARLGTNYTSLPTKRALAYTWELRGGGGAWWFMVVGQGGGAAIGNNWVGGWRGFLVAFDERGVVQAATFKQLSTRRSLDENMNRWVAKLPRTPKTTFVAQTVENASDADPPLRGTLPPTSPNESQ